MGMALQAEVLPDYFEKLQARILQDFTEGVDAWGQSVKALSRWEAEHLLYNPGADVLASHRRLLDRLLQFGRFLPSPERCARVATPRCQPLQFHLRDFSTCRRKHARDRGSVPCAARAAADSSRSLKQ